MRLITRDYGIYLLTIEISIQHFNHHIVVFFSEIQMHESLYSPQLKFRVLILLGSSGSSQHQLDLVALFWLCGLTNP